MLNNISRLCSKWLNPTLLPAGPPFNLWELGLPASPNDYVSIFPWIGVVLMGIGVGHIFLRGIDPFVSWNVSTKITFVGRHSLAVYVLHQPVFFTILGAIYWVIKE